MNERGGDARDDAQANSKLTSSLTRSDELLIHGQVMGKCCHTSATMSDRQDRVRQGIYRTLTVKCDACGAALTWYPAAVDGASARADGGRARLRTEPASAVLQHQIPRYAGNQLLAKAVLRRFERLGWSAMMAARDEKQVCVLQRGAIRLEGAASDLYSDAVYSAAVALARSGALDTASTANTFRYKSSP